MHNAYSKSFHYVFIILLRRSDIKCSLQTNRTEMKGPLEVVRNPAQRWGFHGAAPIWSRITTSFLLHTKGIFLKTPFLPLFWRSQIHNIIRKNKILQIWFQEKLIFSQSLQIFWSWIDEALVPGCKFMTRWLWMQCLPACPSSVLGLQTCTLPWSLSSLYCRMKI